LFGVRQRGKLIDGIAEYLEAEVNVEMCDIEKDRMKENIEHSQKYNKNYFDRRHKKPHKYKEGD